MAKRKPANKKVASKVRSKPKSPKPAAATRPPPAAKRTQAPPEHEYVLGTQSDEHRRLGLQHQLWRSQAYSAFERAGFKRGHRLIDLGAGPGYTSFDLAEVVGPEGGVLSVDMSQRFLSELRHAAQARGIHNIETLQADVQSLDLAPNSFDGAYARWVFCFLQQPERVLAAMQKALRPGGAICIQDYLHYAATTLMPPSPTYTRVVEAVDQSWRDEGGDPEIGMRLPSLLEKHGFEVRHIEPIIRLARPGEPLWQWPDTFFGPYARKLVERSALRAADAQAFDADWEARSRDPETRFVSPTVVTVIATRRR